jgi:NnrS protein
VRELPVYRPFALAAFAATLVVGTPVGIWMASWLYLGAPAVPVEWILLHAHLQIFGFFAMLIPGVAPHLFARFTGRGVTRGRATGLLFALLVGGMVSRICGTWGRRPELILVGAFLEAVGFVMFGLRVWRSLDPPPLALLRWHLTLSTGWFALACLAETALRSRALRAGLALPDVGGLRATHVMGLFGGVIGWVLGVLLRAGPMFVPSWRVPLAAARAIPWVLALGVCLAAAGEAGGWAPSTGIVVARLGEFIVLASVAAVMVTGGVARRTGGALPMLARSPQEARIFRLAAASAGLAVIGSAGATAAAWSDTPAPLLVDAVRHLVTIGFLTSVVVAMVFRLIPVLEETALPWPRLRGVAFWALLAGVLLRSGEVAVGHGWSGPAPWVPLSGLLVSLALGCAGANVIGAIVTASGGGRGGR